ncbi:unnamed protein product [Toxocara canis]|uniref:RT_RNaseH domain-containing protein n=1 Tax=Toxocara canis TaxID=6265 RepID=A0A183UM77_TOXCA|nr:unnamed protein product [Toxocara canis]
MKTTFTSDLLLTRFNPNLPIVIAADASADADGTRTVLSHPLPGGSGKATNNARRALNPTQKNYSQIEKEAFALIFAVRKFHRFLHKRHFTLNLDPKPLLSVFGNNKGIPAYSANSLQRWATTLLTTSLRSTSTYELSIIARRTLPLCVA